MNIILLLIPISMVLLALGVSRPAGRWLRGTHTSWPEHYARHARFSGR